MSVLISSMNVRHGRSPKSGSQCLDSLHLVERPQLVACVSLECQPLWGGIVFLKDWSSLYNC